MSAYLTGLPPGLIYLCVGLLVGIESLGVPLPGETALVAAALLAERGGISIGGVVAAAVIGAVLGDNIGYLIGRRFGPPLLDRISDRFPTHVSHDHLGYARHVFHRWGVLVVFGGRFVALLRMLAGPLAGSMHLHWPRFMLANLAGGLVWAGGTAVAVYLIGAAAHTYLKDFAWVALAVVLAVALLASRAFHRRFEANVAAWAAQQRGETQSPTA